MNENEFASAARELRRIAPFDRLREAELALLAETLSVRRHPPGAEVPAGGPGGARLTIVTRGALRTAAGADAGPIVGLAALFEEQPLERLYADAAAGADVLLMAPHTFFTLVRECPELLRGLLELGPGGRRTEPE